MFEPVALPLHRLPKQTLHHVWAPKLGRPVLLTSQGQLHLWAMLEANPAVTRYCERPSWPAECGPQPSLDFWALRDGQPVWLTSENMSSGGILQEARPSEVIVVQTITAKELKSHRMWIENWLSFLPYLSTTSSLNLDHLRTPVGEFFTREASLGDAEQHFAHIDSVLVRTTVIAELHAGRLNSRDLLTRPWDIDTGVVRISQQALHAPQ